MKLILLILKKQLQRVRALLISDKEKDNLINDNVVQLIAGNQTA